jgi:hypothetical protein
MDNSFWIAVLLVVAILVIAVLYRRGGFKAGLEALGFKMNVEGRGGPEAEAAKPAAPAPSAVPTPTTASTPTGSTHASGAGSVAIGGSADQAKISTKVERGR